jgi:ribosomal protein L7/L12
MSKYLWIGGIACFLALFLKNSRPRIGPKDSGNALPQMTPEQLNEIEELARAGDKISAIKLYRKHTGVDLKEAKDAVEKLLQ